MASAVSEGGPASVTIRQAGPRDLARAGDLFDELDRYQAAWRVFDPRTELRREAEDRYRAAAADPDVLHLVAEDDGRLVGMAFGRVGAISSISDQRVLEVSNVVVVPSHRRRGVARALVRSLAAFARGRGVSRMALKTYLQNDDAMKFWGSLGFRPRYVQMTAAVEELDPPGS
jgi:GNAT superfamily N-acetyltransferase